MRYLKYIKYSLLGLALAVVILYGFDGLLLHYRATPYADVKVDRMFAMVNRYGQTEYSVGSGAYERCVYAVFPHSGISPCWYVNRSTLRYVHVGLALF